MKCISRLSLRRETDDAVHDLCVDLKSFNADLAVVFATHHFGPEYPDLVEGIYKTINCRNLLGCTAEGVIGPTAEIENQPAIALWAARLPDVSISPFVMDQHDLVTLEEHGGLCEVAGVCSDDCPSFIILPDPFSIDIQECLDVLDSSFIASTVVGGMASGASEAGQNRLFLNDQTFRQGLVGVSLTGNLRVDSIVSQGCRPVGRPYVITSVRENLINELGGRPAVSVLQELYSSVDERDQESMRRGLHLGYIPDENQDESGQGTFLVRNMLGITEDKAIAIGAYFRPGQTVQFHVRDAQSATDELNDLLTNYSSNYHGQVAGALLFDCNGRGRSFFNQRDHDIRIVNQLLPDCQTAGFFAQGEIGPIGGHTFVHGFTGSLAFFSQPM